MTRDKALAPLRLRGAKVVMAFIWLNVASILPIGLALGNRDTWIILTLGILMASAPTWLTWRRRHDAQQRVVLGLGLIMCPILFVYLFRGDPWQMDTHMYFFVCFSLLIILCDPWPIIAAAALAVVHHLTFYLLMPAWVFPGSGSVARVLFHGFLVSCEVAILLTAVKHIAGLTLATQEAREDADKARRHAEADRQAAEKAKQAAEVALDASRRAEQRAELEHQDRLAAEAALKSEADKRRAVTADAIEASIGALIVEMNQAAGQFSRQAHEIASASGVLADEARELRSASEDAVMSITHMARNSDDLAESIGVVGLNADLAQRVAASTAQSVSSLGSGLGRLGEEVDAAQSIVALVSEIANQSNLLALNATIEAARSGVAGRGFSVVAAEMKQMALATVRAAAEISEKLSGIVAATAAFRTQIAAATDRVQEITKSSDEISIAVHEQQTATQSIARGADSALGKVSEADLRSSRLNNVASQNRTIAADTEALADQLENRASVLSARMDELLAQLRAA